MNKFLFFFLGLMLFAPLLKAQPTVVFKIMSYYDDNLYRSPQGESDLLNRLNASYQYGSVNGGWSVYFDGDYYSYSSNNRRNFFLPSLGVEYNSKLGQCKQHSFFAGLEGLGRFNQNDYSYYDYLQWYAYAGLRLQFADFFIKGGYNFRYRSYKELPEISNKRHYLYLQFNHTFPTKTTVIIEGDAGYKAFTPVTVDETPSSSGHGRRHDFFTARTVSTTPAMAQAVYLIRVAQSLHPRVGVFAQYRYQQSLYDQTDYRNDQGFYQDEELFDDPFSYNSSTYTGQLTYVAPWRLRIRVGAGLSDKFYISERAYLNDQESAPSGPLREDEKKWFSLRVTKSFYPDKTWLRGLIISLDYSHVVNRSNSYWYDYRNNISGVGIQWKF